ncbi:MAG TPA: TonB-dependent receptor [Sphingomicrobium sp.]|nr:TonB-dependent receptor [Sphingomicrobium sp.]
MAKSIWLLSAGLFALSTPAFAQGTAPDQPTTPSEAATPPTESPVEPGAVDDPDVIVITAQGRTQVLQDVPIAVTAVGGEQMQNSGATDIRQLNQLAPSLLVSSTGSEANGSARIRGIGTVGDNPGLESSVAVFIDGVYRSRSGIGLNELGEIDRIEVLRGPQGTLFGRNASAGLINIISKKPSFVFGGHGELTVGNYDLRRLAGGITGPITDTLAFRLDAVGVKRDGFYYDANNDTDVNDRKRFFTRAQLLYEPYEALSLRLIGDYSKRNEKCCGAVYVNNEINNNIRNLINPVSPFRIGANPNPDGNNIINVLRDLGQNLNAFNDPFSRNISVSRGRGYGGKTTDGGLSLEAKYDFGNVKMTSITGYRGYKASQGGDIDYSTVDILYRADNDQAFRRFKTFSQELRFQGSLFNDKLDWLVGGYFANENLLVTDNLRFGSQYGRFATCRLISGTTLAGLYNPAAPGCLLARPALFGPTASPLIFAAFDRLDSLNDLGSTQDRYKQNSRNYALFTHNIFHVTDQFDVTVGLRYTNERKRFDARFGNDNTVCTANQTALTPFLTSPALAALAGGIITLSCQGNSTAELNGVEINDKRKENKLTGTGVLSYKPNDDLLLYASYSRGYKAGGFNLDRSALKGPVSIVNGVPTTTFAALGGAQALVGRLQFDPETVDAFELGGKFSMRGVTFNVSLFRQQFKNFQLNTFDGSVFIVQNVNGCTSSLNGGDRDQSKFVTAPNFNPAAATTGACDKDDVGYGVRSQGIELEASVRPMPDLRLNAGVTLSSTKYRRNLVGTDDGAPLNQALRELPGERLSNAPKTVATGALAYTPAIGGTGLSGLFYVDARYTAAFNSGSDLFPQKSQRAFTVVNGRIGLRGPDERWAVELWAQNLFDKKYSQVAFNSPFQEGAVGPGFTDPAYPGGRQIFSAFLAEPRTYGLTLRGKFAAPRPVTVAYVAPPAPPPPPAMQTCPDGTMIEVTAMCPAPPPPPPPPPPPLPAPERG